MNKESITILGHYCHTFFRNQGTGEAYFRIIPEYTMPETENGLLRCKGKIKLYAKGMPIAVTGSFDGNTFIVARDAMPVKTKENVIKILDYIVPDLNAVYKETIAEHCGNDLMAFCQKESNFAILCEILKPISNGDAVAKLIFRRVRSITNKNALEEKLLSYGIPFDKIMRILRKDLTVSDINRNPYLVFSKYDIPFRIADIYARKECVIREYDQIRIKGFVHASLKHSLSNGDTCCTLEQLEEIINRRFHDLQEGVYFGRALINACILDMPNVCGYHVINGTAYIYLNHVWEEETIAIQNLIRLASVKKEYSHEIGINETEAALGIRYNAGQREAFRLIEKSGVKILTGPPGAGKTAVILGLIHNFESNRNGTVHLAATTGMAAKVMRGATERDSETAHKMLRVLPYNDTAKGRDLNDPVDADLVIVDEVSMMGLQLFSVLTQAIKNGSILILVGDEDQLLSVDYGNVLHDLIKSGLIEVCRLTEVMRQSGLILENARKINQGENRLGTDPHFQIKEIVGASYADMLLSDYDTKWSQIICPVKKGTISTASINQLIQEHYNSKSPVVAVYGKHIFRLNDKIIMTKTEYEKGYINGDIGYIIDHTNTGELLVSFPEGNLYLTKDDYCNMELAYAITIHKSQGSEFQKVHIVLPKAAGNMMTKRLLFTAVTRAKETDIIYYEGTSLTDAIKDKAERKRMTLFSQILQNRYISAKKADF